jgi:flagella basal body P-ring formation protein FlgA
MVRRGEVELRPINKVSKGFEYVSQLEDVLGREATRQLDAGQPVDARSLRQPVMVRRNEVVAVLAKGAGVKVRTSAKALEDGSLGDLINVETVEQKIKQRFTARVVGLQEAEVYVSAHVAE